MGRSAMVWLAFAFFWVAIVMFAIKGLFEGCFPTVENLLMAGVGACAGMLALALVRKPCPDCPDCRQTERFSRDSGRVERRL